MRTISLLCSLVIVFHISGIRNWTISSGRCLSTVQGRVGIGRREGAVWVSHGGLSVCDVERELRGLEYLRNIATLVIQ